MGVVIDLRTVIRSYPRSQITPGVFLPGSHNAPMSPRASRSQALGIILAPESLPPRITASPGSIGVPRIIRVTIRFT